jgi:UDP-glucose 4-epimerase
MQVGRRPELVSLDGKSVLVTGGAGFIGSHLCDTLLKRHIGKLIIADNFSTGKDSNISQFRGIHNVLIRKMDASDWDLVSKLFDEFRIDVVFNLAVVPLPASLEKPKNCIDQNVLITTTMSELLREGKYSTLIHCSSSEAYGTALYVPMDEEHPTLPLTPYAASKIACDHIVLSYRTTFDLDVAIARPFNTFGPRQNEGTYAGVVPLTINRILDGKSPIIQGDGLQTRDYSFVEDIAEGITRIYENKVTRGRIVNLASGEEKEIKRIIAMIMSLMGYSGEPIFKKPRPADVRRHRGDISLARRLINYSPTSDFEPGLTKTIEWYRKARAKARER